MRSAVSTGSQCYVSMHCAQIVDDFADERDATLCVQMALDCAVTATLHWRGPSPPVSSVPSCVPCPHRTTCAVPLRFLFLCAMQVSGIARRFGQNTQYTILPATWPSGWLSTTKNRLLREGPISGILKLDSGSTPFLILCKRSRQSRVQTTPTVVECCLKPFTSPTFGN